MAQFYRRPRILQQVKLSRFPSLLSVPVPVPLPVPVPALIGNGNGNEYGKR